MPDELVTSEEATEVGDEDCEPPSRFVSDMLSSIGDGRPREMISLCSSSSELMECFCRMSGPVIDLAMSGLGKSLKLVCCREGIPSSVRVYVRVARKSPATTAAAAALPARSSFCSVFACVCLVPFASHTLAAFCKPESLVCRWWSYYHRVGVPCKTGQKDRESDRWCSSFAQKYTRYSHTHNHESRVNGRMITNELTACGTMLLLNNRMHSG